MSTQSQKILVVLDYGHGQETPGKRSPDSSLYEWRFNRDLGLLIKEGLLKQGISTVETLSTECLADPALSVRAQRANDYFHTYKKDHFLIFISIHGNAAGNGKDWFSARGWSGFVCKNAGSDSKLLASVLAQGAESQGLKVRRPTAKQDYWEENFTVLTKTAMPAVLTENLFYDNKEDCEIMKSPDGLNKLASAHIYGVQEFIKQKQLSI